MSPTIPLPLFVPSKPKKVAVVLNLAPRLYAPPFCPTQYYALLLQKCVKISSGYFFIAHSQNQPSKMFLFSYIPPHPPPPPEYFRHVFLLLLGIPLRHLGGWLSTIQKFPWDLKGIAIILYWPDFCKHCERSWCKCHVQCSQIRQVIWLVAP